MKTTRAFIFAVVSFLIASVALAQAPAITSFSPATVGSGLSVVLTGTGFTGATAVKFNGLSATFTVNSDTQITATVPSSATTGAITVTTAAGTGTSATNVTFTTAPVISGFKPASAPEKRVVKIEGANFDGSTAFYFNGTRGNGIGWNQNYWYVAVPIGATTGPVTAQGNLGTGTSPASFVVTTATPPANDSFASAEILAGASGTVDRTNVGATKQTGEPNNAGNAGGSSIWFKWTAPSTGPFLFNPTPGDFGLNVGIYTGLSVESLTSVAAGPSFFVNSYRSAVVLNAAVGTTYAISVDGSNGYTGNFTLAWAPLAAPTATSFSPSSAYAGQRIVISGTGFVPGATVTIGGSPVNSARAYVDSPTSITVDQLPFAAVTGPVVVTTPAGSATSVANLTVTLAPAPVITGFSPAVGVSGTYVTINGTALALGDALPIVRFNGVQATSVLNDYSTSIGVNIPTGATTGRITVQTSAGTATSATDFTVPLPPVITVEPANQTAAAGGSVSFSVTATSSVAATYQWSRNGTAIAGATNATLALSNLQLADVGKYTVTVSNIAGSVTSTAANLSGSEPGPTITTQPASVSVTTGQTATLTVAATGAGPLAYQWRRNGVIISGATGASYTLTGASRMDADNYDVLVVNGLSVTTSAVARLSVAPTSYPGAVMFDRSAAMLLEDANSGYVQSVVALAGGKFLAVGEFASVNGQRRLGIARFNADGTLDPTFVPPEFNDTVYTIAVQTDGKILAGGWFTRVGGQARNCLVRLNADGTLDGAFDLNVTSSVYAMASQADGKIVLGGYFTSVGGQTRNRLARLNADGTLDAGFSSPAMDTGVYRLAVQADGKVVIGGWFTSVGGVLRNRIARVNADGSLDSAFDPNANNQISALAVQSDGKILLGGYFSNVGGQTRNEVARLNADGTVDSGFNPGANGSVQALAVQSDGRILLGGDFFTLAGQTRNQIARLNADGTLDTGFNPSGNGAVYSFAQPGDGTILVGGNFSSVGGQARSRLAKLDANGALLAAPSPTLRAAGYVRSMVNAAGGKFYVGGRFTHLNGLPVSSNLMRVNADATVDASFAPAPNGEVIALAMQGDGRLVLGGGFGTVAGQSRASLARLNPDGTIDAGFISSVNWGVNAVALQSDGKIALGGSFNSVGGQSRTYLARVNADGSVDSGFNPNPATADYRYINALAVQPDGKIVVGGQFTSLGGQARNYLARVNADGSLDAGFNPNPSWYIYSVMAQADGKVLVGGSFYTIGGQSRGNFARLNADGTADSGFNTSNGFNGEVWSILPQEDGRILAGGSFSSLAGAANTAQVARLNADGTRDATFQFAVGAASFRPAYALLLTDSGQLWVGGSEDYGYSLARLLPASVPVIATQPVSQTASVGGTVTFSVAASGAPAPTYQWKFNGIAVPGATNAILTLSNVQVANVGGYSVTVDNGIGSVTSNTATLGGANPVPTITAQPQNATVTAGQNATLSVSATGTLGLTYQWRRNGFNIAGATGASFTLTAASRTDADLYDVIVYSGLSATMSSAARMSVAPSSYASSVTLDAGKPAVFEDDSANINRIWPLADGRFYAAGRFVNIDGTARSGLVRFTAGGTLDPTFASLALPSGDYAIYDLVVQSDGKLIVGGYFYAIAGGSRSNLARLNADGTLDPAFATRGVSSNVYALALQADGKILVGGNFSSFYDSNYASTARAQIARLNADGTLDAAFNPGANGRPQAFAVQTDGKILVGGDFTTIAGQSRSYLARLNADGTFDAGFASGAGPNSRVQALRVQGDGRILAAGWFTSYNGASAGRIVRLEASGAVDAGFATGTGFTSDVNALAVQADGKIVAGGYFGNYAGTSRNSIARLATNGALDATFVPSSISSVVSLALAADGRVLAGGYVFSGGVSRSGLGRLNADGTLDPTWVPVFRSGGSVFASVLLPGGKVLAGGQFTHINGVPVTGRNLARFNADGTVDAAFNPGSGPSSGVNALLVQPDGRIVLGGSFFSYNGTTKSRLARIMADGALDSGFPAGGAAPSSTVFALAAAPGGRLMIGGYFTTVGSTMRNRIARLNADGSLDPTFDPGAGPRDANGFGDVEALAVAADGKVYLGGNFVTVAGQPRNFLARLNADGSLDPAFGDPGLNSSVVALALQPDGKVIAGGYFYGTVSGLARFNADGTRDTSFVSSGVNSVSSLVLQEDGRVVAGGYFNSVGGSPNQGYLARFNADGTGDTGFSATGLGTAARTITVRDNGQLFLGGNYGLGGAFTVPTTNATPVIVTPPQSVTASVGTNVTFSVVASGVPAPGYQWKKGGADIAGATNATLTLTNIQATNAGNYTVVVSNSSGSVTSTAAALTVTPAGPTRGLVNGSVLATLDTAAPVLTAVFTIEGSTAKQMLIRAAGPSLASLGVTNAMADSQLEIFNASTGASVAVNDDWGSAANAAQVATVAAQVGAFPFAAGSKDAAVVATFPPGTYRVRVSGVGNSSGTAIVEIYDADATPRLVYLALRSRVSGSLTYGFVVSNLPAGRSYLIRALGPTLGVPGALADPVLTVYSGQTQVAANDNWGGDAALASLAAAVGAMPLPSTASKDAALNFTPAVTGGFTAQVSGVGGTTGLALLEIFEVDAQRSATLPAAIVSQPENVTVNAGQSATFGVVTVGAPMPTYQWRKNAVAVSGASSASYTLTSTQAGDAGSYDVVVTNSGGTSTSSPAVLTVNGAANSASHAVVGAGYFPGGTATITNTISYSGTASALGWLATLPAGWSFASDGGAAGDAKPAVGTTGVIEWAWSSPPASPVTFTYTVNVPAGNAGDKTVTANAIVRASGGVTQPQAAPNPLTVAQVTAHSADEDRNFRINLFELTRVIELYNTRNGTTRTGCYAVQAGTEDGFAPDPARAGGTVVTLAPYHSADEDRNGKLSLLELTRVIELYNYRSGTTRTGQYHAQIGTEDGFAPGP